MAQAEKDSQLQEVACRYRHTNEPQITPRQALLLGTMQELLTHEHCLLLLCMYRLSLSCSAFTPSAISNFWSALQLRQGRLALSDAVYQ